MRNSESARFTCRRNPVIVAGIAIMLLRQASAISLESMVRLKLWNV